MTLKRWLGLGLGCLSATLAACDGAPMSQRVYLGTAGVMESVRAAAAGSNLLVEVHGNPFAVGQEAVDAAVVETFQEALSGTAGVHMTSDPSQAARPDYRVVVVLGADPAQDGNALARGEIKPLRPKADPVELVAIFRYKTDVLSEVRGSIGRPGSPEDTTFRKWLWRVGRDLLPPNPLDPWWIQKLDKVVPRNSPTRVSAIP